MAEKAGVTPATVSRALSERTRHQLLPETVQRIEKVAEELGYQPDEIALGRTVGVLVPDMANPLFPLMLRGIEDVLRDAGYTAVFANTDNDPAREESALRNLQARRVDGFIAATARRHDPLLTATQDSGTPLVLMLRRTQGPGMWSVCPDEAETMQLVVEHLAGLGHRRIAHLAGPQDLWNGYQRYRGFKESMESCGLEVDERLVGFGRRFSLEEGRRLCDEMLDRRASFTAVVAGNDLMAIGCVDALKERGIQCPEQVSVSGVNDMPLADHLNPPLTTVRLPQREMGVAAAQMLLYRLAHRRSTPRRQLLTPELVVRGSTAKAR
ncbi:LacI family DNA-binding transcriptional regulator [Streptomyces sp. 7N604]|uniref:LacI family DNA-binding transcriptional regulator n=1 Tax=Streptomyces sp. 7N604 TaxID=3457415 RepID=UPI003FCF9EB5